MQDPVAKASYDRITNDPAFWRNSAYSLKISAHALKPKALQADSNLTQDGWGIRSVLNMLYAMSLECILKAIYLEHGDQIAENGKMMASSKLPWESNGPHDLLGLANSLPLNCVILTNDDKSFLSQIQPFIELGRYPTRAKCDRENPGCFQTNPNGTGVLGSSFPAMPWCDTAFASLSQKLESATTCGAPKKL